MTKLERKKKIENFWYYYKIHTFVAIFIIFAIIVTVTTRDTSKKYGFTLTFIGQNVMMSDKLNDFQKKIAANINSMNMGGNIDQQIQMANVSKFMALMQVGELDVIIGDKATFSNYAKQGAFMKLDDFVKNGRFSKDNKYENISDVSGKYSVGIDIKSSKLLKAYGYDYADTVIGIAATSKNLEKSIALINQLLN